MTDTKKRGSMPDGGQDVEKIEGRKQWRISRGKQFQPLTSGGKDIAE